MATKKKDNTKSKKVPGDAMAVETPEKAVGVVETGKAQDVVTDTDPGFHIVGIVLSGTGSDGTMGIRAIKGNGGMVMVQNPASTDYNGMPRSALATGMVDYELAPVEMPAQLIAYATHAFDKPRRPVTEKPPKAENTLKKIFMLLRAHTGHDFSQYKPNTVHRRNERRMVSEEGQSEFILLAIEDITEQKNQEGSL